MLQLFTHQSLSATHLWCVSWFVSSYIHYLWRNHGIYFFICMKFCPDSEYQVFNFNSWLRSWLQICNRQQQIDHSELSTASITNKYYGNANLTTNGVTSPLNAILSLSWCTSKPLWSARRPSSHVWSNHFTGNKVKSSLHRDTIILVTVSPEWL